jgi:hypothetical protein
MATDPKMPKGQNLEMELPQGNDYDINANDPYELFPVGTVVVIKFGSDGSSMTGHIVSAQESSHKPPRYYIANQYGRLALFGRPMQMLTGGLPSRRMLLQLIAEADYDDLRSQRIMRIDAAVPTDDELRARANACTVRKASAPEVEAYARELASFIHDSNKRN